ncbi:MAG: NAD(P)/FAD-dependent oxidoreductase [Candidatus Methanoplasma sp.]|jgi:thioredoxin reductase (NADPH)|nr:NAD(P)/FAD-dependent oxidoreductase [Candidatus Methanoplasma sp.]
MDFDVMVIGSGPAGIQAAIHSARRKARTVLLGKAGNSAMAGAKIENYFGTGGPEDGSALLAKGLSQAEAAGCSAIGKNAVSASAAGGSFSASLESGAEISARAVVLATGVSRNSLGIPGEKELFGKGVSYCASCDCNFYKGVPVVVIGGDSEAALAAELMTGYASEVRWIADGVAADPILVERARRAGAALAVGRPVRISGSAGVESVALADGTEIPARGVFIELGGRSSADLAMDLGIMPEPDDSVKVDGGCRTSVAGVFACGDVTGRPWQVARAVGQGAVAGSNAADYSKGAGS